MCIAEMVELQKWCMVGVQLWSKIWGLTQSVAAIIWQRWSGVFLHRVRESVQYGRVFLPGIVEMGRG